MNKINVKTQALFITNIWTADMSFPDDLLIKWNNHLTELMNSGLEKRGKSNVGGWNSPANLAANEIYKPLAVATIQLMKQILADDLANCGLEMWGNILNKGSFNVQHHHPSSILSACFYVCTPSNSSNLILIDPRPGPKYTDNKKFNINKTQVSEVVVKPGMLVVFPSWLEHRVDPNNSEEPRVSIAMNLVNRINK